MRILYNSLIDADSSYTATSENIAYPIVNALDSRLSKEYRSTIVSTSDYIIVNESSIAPTYIGLVNHNISSSATLYVEASSSSGFTGAYSTTMAWSSYTALHNIGASTAKSYWRVRIEGNSTLNSYLRIGYLYLGTYLQMPGMEKNQEIAINTTAKANISDSGQLYGDDGYNYRSFKCNFPYLTNQERSDISTMYNTVKSYKPIILNIWNNSTEERAMYCYIAQDTVTFGRTDDNNMRWKTGLVFREVF